MQVEDILNAVKIRFPEVSEPLFLMALNSTLKEFVGETKMLKDVAVTPSVINQRYYELPEDVKEILRIDYDGSKIHPINGNLVTDSEGHSFNPPVLPPEDQEWSGPITHGGAE